MAKKKIKYNRIKEVLVAKDLTQVWLSDELNKSYSVVTEYVNNHRQPSLEVLYRIAELLDVNVKELLYDTKI